MSVKLFAPDLDLAVRNNLRPDVPTAVKAESCGEWCVSECVCLGCSRAFADPIPDIRKPAYTVTHVASTYAAAMHLGLATARRFARAMDKEFPKFLEFDAPIVKANAHIFHRLRNKIILGKKVPKA